MGIASMNDFSEWWPRGAAGPNRSLYGESKCQVFRETQSMACDCVPTELWENTLQERIEAFFGLHAPTYLNKKGKMKDKKLWKSWRGKKPMILLHLLMAQ